MISILIISMPWKSHKDFFNDPVYQRDSEGMTSIKNKQEKKTGGYGTIVDGYGK